MPHKLLFLDFETYYDNEYSLSKMAPPNYILDERFETIGCAVKDGALGQSFFVDGPDFGSFIKSVDASTTTTVTFNALFDNCILAWKYNFIPARMLCAMRMASALRGHILQSASLASVSKCLKVGTKGTEIENVKGKRRAEIMNNPGLWRAFQAYAENDNELSAAIFFKLLPEFPVTERKVMDRVLRCAVDPKFHVDKNMLSQHLEDLKKDKIRMLRLANGAKEEDLNTESFAFDEDHSMEAALEAFAGSLRSNDKFEALLKARGVDIEYKASISDPSRSIPAFAKTDQFMSDLQEHDDPIVQALAAARLGVRSTIEETRGARILSIAELAWPSYCDGNIPIPLRFSGAHTHRLSGDWKINMQNLPSGRGTQKSKLRKSLIAPDGHKVIVADLAQIEARITAWLCGQLDLLKQFTDDLDPYSILASGIFGFKVDKKIHLIERFIGKSGVLGLGFRCGAAKFYNMVVRSGRTLGLDMSELLKIWTPELAQTSVDAYRQINRSIVNTWYTLDRYLQTAWCGLSAPVKFGPVTIGPGYVLLPNGMKMNYDVVCRDPGEGLSYRYGKRIFQMHGGKFLENKVQALARIIIMNAAMRLDEKGYRFCLQSHDELAFIIPDADVENCKKIVHAELIKCPSWGTGLPLAAEVGSGQSYGDAK